MRFYERWLDNTLQRIGYSKANASGWVPMDVVFESEAPASQRLEFDQWTDEQKERLAITLSWVYANIQLIAGKCAEPELGIYEQTGETLEAVVDHPLERLLQQPFPFWPRSLTMRYTFQWWLLRGEAYWWKVLDGGGELAQLLPVPAGRMRPIPDAKEYISGFAYKPKHGKPAKRIPKEQVVFFRFPNPFDFHRGLSPRTGYQWPLETDIAAVRWNRDTFVKEATLRTLIGLPAELDDKVYRQAKEEILRELVEKGRRYMVARSGRVTAEQLGLSHKELEFLGGREFSREEIDRVFGIPAGYWAKEATRANSEAAEAKLISNTVWPMLVMMSDAITEQVVIPHYGEEYRARFEDIRPRDRKLLVAERRQYWQVKTVDEARADLGLTALDDTVMGATLVPLATRGPAVSTDGERYGGGAGPQVVGKSGSVGVWGCGSGGGNGSGRKAVRKELQRWRSKARRAGDEVEFVSEVIPPTLAAMVKAAVGKFGAEDGFRFLKAAPDGRDAVERRLGQRIREILERWLGVSATEIEEGREPDYSELSGELRSVLEPELEDIATEVAIREAMEVGVEFDPAVVNAAAADWARSYSYELIGGLTETTRGVVSRAMQQAIEMTLTREQLEALLRPAFGDVRASMIAVTETTRAYSAATRMYANLLEMEAGIRMEGVWRTRADELVCPICGPFNGKREGVWQDDFPEGPPAHVNCRCWTTLEYVGKGS